MSGGEAEQMEGKRPEGDGGLRHAHVVEHSQFKAIALGITDPCPLGI